MFDAPSYSQKWHKSPNNYGPKNRHGGAAKEAKCP